MGGEQGTVDGGQGPLSDVGRPLSSAPGDLEFPFAVYTAKFGYEWSNVPAGMTRADLADCYKRASASKPEFLKDGETAAGTFVRNGFTVVFLIQVAKKWDANGRDAEYGAFAFVPLDKAAAVDLKALLARREFREPDRNPPQTVKAPCVPGAEASGAGRPPAPARVSGEGRGAPDAGRGTEGFAARAAAPDARGPNWIAALLWIGAAALVAMALVSALRG